MPQETIIPGYRLTTGETITYTARAASLGHLAKALRRINPADALDDELEIALFETWLAGLESAVQASLCHSWLDERCQENAAKDIAEYLV